MEIEDLRQVASVKEISLVAGVVFVLDLTSFSLSLYFFFYLYIRENEP